MLLSLGECGENGLTHREVESYYWEFGAETGKSFQ